MRTCLKQTAGFMSQEEFQDNLAAYEALRDRTGYVFAERIPFSGVVYVYYEVDAEFIAYHPQSSLSVDQIYVEFGL